MTETFNVNTDKQKMLCTTVIVISNMPLAHKLRKEKVYFARLSLIIMITSFNRIWHLRELVFIKGGSSAKWGSLLSVIYSMTHLLTHTDPCRRRK